MKKMFLFAAMAGVAFASCTNDVTSVDNSALESKAIAWDTHVMSTRANLATDVNFASMAFSGTTPYFSDIATGKGAKVGYGLNTSYATSWVTENLYYWPLDGGNLGFVSVAPYDDNSVASYDYTLNSDAIEFEYMVPVIASVNETQATTLDILYASKAECSENQVPVAFTHALAKLNVVIGATKVNLRSEETNKEWDIKVSDVVINDIDNTGSVNLTWNGSAWTVANSVWTEATSSSVNQLDLVTADKDITYSGTLSHQLLTELWIMPQAVKGKTLKITYSITTKSYDDVTATDRVETAAAITKTYKKVIDLNSVAIAGTDGTDYYWQMNKNITYTVDINPSEDATPILWAQPTVADFVSDGATINIDKNNFGTEQ